VTEGPVDLTEFAPAECPDGHVLRIGRNPSKPFIGGRVAVSFAGCLCPAAMAKPGSAGHMEVACEACRAEGRESTWRDPQCAVKPDAS
jgi:hypothetical protein